MLTCLKVLSMSEWHSRLVYEDSRPAPWGCQWRVRPGIDPRADRRPLYIEEWAIIPVRATSPLPSSRARQTGLPGALRRLGAGAGLVVPAAALDAPAVHLR